MPHRPFHKKTKEELQAEARARVEAIPEPEAPTAPLPTPEAVGRVPTLPEAPSETVLIKDKFIVPRKEAEALKAQGSLSTQDTIRLETLETQRQEQIKKVIEIQAKRERGEVLSAEDLATLKATARIGELREQILNPQIDLTNFAQTISNISGGEVSIEEAEKLFGGAFSAEVSRNSNDIQNLASQIRANLVQKAGGLIIGIDGDLRNMEASLINHKEGSADVLRAVQSGAFNPTDALTDLNQMVDDINEVEATIELMSIYAPSVYGEAKGWEFQTRFKKIRRAILARQAEVINFAATGVPLPITGEAAGTPPPVSRFFG